MKNKNEKPLSTPTADPKTVKPGNLDGSIPHHLKVEKIKKEGKKKQYWRG